VSQRLVASTRGPKTPHEQAAALAIARRWDEAELAFRAILRRQDTGEIRQAIATCLMCMHRTEEAIAEYRRALKRDPTLVRSRNNLIFLLDHRPETTIGDAWRERHAWWKIHGAPLAPQCLPHDNRPDPERPLRVGYLSADFRGHSAAFGFGPVVLRHTAAVDVYCYSLSNLDDSMTDLFRAKAAGWRDCVASPPLELVDRIRADAIDLLVDLSGFSAGNSLQTFCYKPAPVQVTAWGYATGTGCKVFDAFFADAFTVPAHLEPYYTEPVVRLPSIVPYIGPEYAPPVTVRDGTQPFTFGSFSRPEKCTVETLRLWCEVLRRVPGSRLVVKDNGYGRPETAERLRRDCGRRGVDPSRIDVRGFSDHGEHLGAYGEVDLVLDTMPHTGGISTLEALWMGVPVVTLPGERTASRLSGSFLTNLDLTALIAGDAKDYVEIAVQWSGRRAELATLRATLRDRVTASPINTGYVRAVEAAYRDLWRAWCRRQGPR
jgi:predicted O-linked N-acetylglucosamine transferase (SPINDLY family)